MLDTRSVRNGRVTSDERIRNILHRYIQRAFDTETYTRHTLSEFSGVSLCQIDQIMAGDPLKHRRITGEDMLNLAYALGTDVVNSLNGTIRHTARRLDEEDSYQASMIVATILPHVSTIATAAADGRIDHRERPMCRDAADQIIRTMAPLSSAGGAA